MAQEAAIKPDLRIFFTHEFAKIKNEFPDRTIVGSLPTDWPGDEKLSQMVNKADPLFIVAFTICRYISGWQPGVHPDTQLARALELGFSTGLEGTYLPILKQAFPVGANQAVESRATGFRSIIGPLVLLFDPMSITALIDLLAEEGSTIGGYLSPLKSVLSVPGNAKDHAAVPIKLFHLSFRDFLISPESEDFRIEESETHRKLTGHCIALLEKKLKEDVCGMKAPGTRRSAVRRETIEKALPEAVTYACCYWVQHLLSSKVELVDDDHVHRFLRKHFLHWTEALVWLGKFRDVIYSLNDLQTIVHADRGSQLALFLDDASRFALRFRAIIDEAPLQIYLSALVFAPSQSIMRRTFGNNLGRYLSVLPVVPEIWDAERIRLEGHEGEIRRIAMSADGKTVVSRSLGTMRLWSTVTGEEILKFNDHVGSYDSLAISPDGKKVAWTNLFDKTDKAVWLWSTPTGEVTDLVGHRGRVTDVAISADGTVLASGSEDRTVRIWSTATGKEMHTIELEDPAYEVAISADGKTIAAIVNFGVLLWSTTTGETLKLVQHGRVRAIAITADGKMLVSALDDGDILLWSTVTREETLKLKAERPIRSVAITADGKTVGSRNYDGAACVWSTASGTTTCRTLVTPALCIAISADGKTIASGGSDGMVRLWSREMLFEERQRVDGNDHRVQCMAISDDGKTVVTGSDDTTMRLWSTATGKEMLILRGHESFVFAIAISADGKTVVTGYQDTTVRLWSTVTGKEMLRLEDHDAGVKAVAISADGKTVASADFNDTVRLWSAATGDEIRRFESTPKLENLRFNGSTLEANIGLFDLDFSDQDSSSDQVSWSDTDSALDLRRVEKSPSCGMAVTVDLPWVKYHGSDLLWLPHEYRGDTYGENRYITRGDFLAIGHQSGARGISMFRFCMQEGES